MKFDFFNLKFLIGAFLLGFILFLAVFGNLLTPFGILEMLRTGLVAMVRGQANGMSNGKGDHSGQANGVSHS